MQSQPLIYLSPGITFSINTNGYFVVSPKLSLGILANDGFYNITYAKAWSSDTSAYPHSLIEFQYGTQSPKLEFRKQYLFVGGGIGITIPSSPTGNKPSMRFTIFTGFLYYLNTTILFTNPIQSDFGGQVVLPIPLNLKVGNLNG